jgi:hypothetical protein
MPSRSERAWESGVEIEVIDHGTGLRPTTSRVFDAFVTLRPGGNGLGLTISRQIVEQLGYARAQSRWVMARRGWPPPLLMSLRRAAGRPCQNVPVAEPALRAETSPDLRPRAASPGTLPASAPGSAASACSRCCSRGWWWASRTRGALGRWRERVDDPSSC